MKPLTPEQAGKWGAIRQKGRLRFVLGYGRTGVYGILLAQVFYFASGNMRHLFAIFNQTSPILILLYLSIFFSFGLIIGWLAWSYQEKRYAEFKRHEP